MKMPWSFLTRRRTAELSPTEIAEAKAAFDPGGASSDLLDEQPPAAVPSPVAPTDTAANFEDTSKSLVPAQGRREEAEHAIAEKAEVQSSPPAIKPSSRRGRPDAKSRTHRSQIGAPDATMLAYSRWRKALLSIANEYQVERYKSRTKARCC